jgi:hypothetical protein
MIKLLFILLFWAGVFVNANTNTSVFLKDTSIQKMDTLHIMISEANYIYYYKEPLQSDASNFNVTNHRGVRSVIQLHADEAKNQNHKLIILLKIQKLSALNESSKSAIDFIKKQNYNQVDLKEVEKELIRITEQAL